MPHQFLTPEELDRLAEAAKIVSEVLGRVDKEPLEFEDPQAPEHEAFHHLYFANLHLAKLAFYSGRCTALDNIERGI